MSNGSHLVAVVDDEPAVCRALERLLRASASVEVETFTSGAEFLESLSARRPDCVVLDLHMPRMSGFDVQARLASEGAGQITVVVITAHDSPAAQERAMAAGAVAYLRKPVDARPLLDAVRAALALKPP